MQRSRRYPSSFYLVVAANLFFFASFQWLYVTLPAFVLSLGGNAAYIGLAYGLSTLSAVASRPVLGRLVDRWGCKPVLAAGAAVFCLCPLLYSLTHSLGPFMAVRLLHGLGMAAFTTAYTALVADLATPERLGEAVGLSGMTNNLGMLFAPALGAAVAARWGYGPHFWAAAGLAGLCLAVLLPVKGGRPVTAAPGGRHSLRAVGRHRGIVAAALGGTGLAVAYGTALGFVAPSAAQRGLTAAAGYFSAFALATMATQAAAGWTSDRTGRRVVAAPGLLLAALAIGGLALARSNLALLAAGAGLGLSWGLVRAGLDSAVVDAAPPEARGTALGLVYTCFDLGIGAGSFGLGIVAQAQGYAMAFGLAAGWAIAALLGYVTLDRRRG